MQLLASIPLTELSLLPALINDYIQKHNTVKTLYQHYTSIESFKDVIAAKKNQPINRVQLASVLTEQYTLLPKSNLVAANISALSSENTFTVTAAHQPCLFLGPLYNIYKICHVIKLAQQLSQQYPEYKFVPVFWLGTEDHDIEELSHAFINGEKFVWENPGTGASGKWSTSSLAQLQKEGNWNTGNVAIDEILQRALSSCSTFGGFTQYIIHELFKNYGLVVLDQNHQQLKKQFAAVMADEIFNQRAQQILQSTVNFLEQHYKAQAKPRDINFFYLNDNSRERILFDSSTHSYTVNNTPLRFTKEELANQIANHPECFSPNVILRPLYQEMVLPNLAFVGGAGELSYWLELKPLFDYYEVPYPVQVLRSSATILTTTAKRRADKTGLSITEFFSPLDTLIKTYIQQNTPADLLLEEEKERLATLFNVVIAKAEAADVTLKNSAAAEKQKALSAIDNIASKMLKAEKRKQETALQQIQSVHETVWPGGVLQERRENFIPFYNEELIPSLIDSFDAFCPAMHVFAHQ